MLKYSLIFTEAASYVLMSHKCFLLIIITKFQSRVFWFYYVTNFPFLYGIFLLWWLHEIILLFKGSWYNVASICGKCSKFNLS